MMHGSRSIHTPSRRSVVLLFAALFALACAGTAAAEGPEGPWLDDLEAAQAKASAQGANILVDLYADWCGWCKVLEERVFSTPEFQKYIEEQGFVLLRVDTEDGAEGSALQARYRAHSLPTTLILDSKMVKVGQIAGFAPTEEFIGYIDSQLGAWQVILKNFDKVVSSGDVDLQRMMAEDMHERGDGARAAALYGQVLERVQEGTDASAWLHYLTADAYRIDRQFDLARKAAKRSRAVATGLSGLDELNERLDLLSFYIAQDNGDCQQAKTSLQLFLDDHPASTLRPQLKRALDALNRGEGTCA
ncbi:MAG: thioredoxin family protein [Acidobacteriota bacterium]